MTEEQRGKNFGQLTNTERLELTALGLREQVIQELFQRIVREQEELATKRDAWFIKIRESHNVPTELTIQIVEDHWIYEVINTIPE